MPGNQCHQLHKNAKPSVFPQFPKHLQKTESKRKSPVKRKFVESKTSTFEPSPSKIKMSVNIEHAYISKETPDAKIICPYVAVLKIEKATKNILRSRVVSQNMFINTEKNLDLKIECAVFVQLGSDIFNNVPGHFFEHRLGIESDHPSSLLRIVARNYIKLRLKHMAKSSLKWWFIKTNHLPGIN